VKAVEEVERQRNQNNDDGKPEHRPRLAQASGSPDTRANSFDSTDSPTRAQSLPVGPETDSTDLVTIAREACMFRAPGGE
jgi:hypothetical protein